MHKRVLTLDEAKRIATAAETFAVRNGFKVVICVVDDGGHPLYLQRGHDTQFASVEVAIGKAKTAIAFKRPTVAWEERLRQGRLGYLSLTNQTALQGGLPLRIGDDFVGAIGVSGVASEDDERTARAGVDALTAIANGPPR